MYNIYVIYIFIIRDTQKCLLPKYSPLMFSDGYLNIKMPSYQHRDFTCHSPLFHFYSRNPHTCNYGLNIEPDPGSPPVMPCNKVHLGTILGLLPSGPIYEISIAIFPPYLPVGSGGLKWPVITLLLAIPTGWEDLFPESCVIKIYPKIYVCGEDWVWGLNSHFNLFLHTIHSLN